MAGAVAVGLVGFVTRPDPSPLPPLSIEYVISPDAEELFTPLVAEFNRDETKSNGRVVHVTLSVESSGNAAKKIGSQIEPVVWTPAASIWAELLSKNWRSSGARSLMQSPEVVAVWKTEADRLGLGSSIRFSELVDLVASHQLDFGHTDPASSTSGLYAVVSEFSGLSGKSPDELTIEDVSDKGLRQTVSNFEWNTVRYVDIARDFADEWCQYGVGFASAAYMQETTLVRFHARCRTQLRAIYLTDLPFVADYPFIVLRAPWVTAEEREGASMFGAWLESRLTSYPRLAEGGFRRGKTVTPDRTSGIDPTQPSSPPPGIPAPQVVRRMQAAWAELRRPANVVLLADESQRMATEGKEELAKEALLRFLACPGSGPQADDQVGLITYGGQGPKTVRTRVPLADFDSARQKLEAVINSLAARDGAALYDAIDRALTVAGLLDPEPLRTIVVLGDGSDDSSSTTPRELERKLRERIASHVAVQVLVVPYGSDEQALDLLQEHVVGPSLGRYFKGDVSNLDDVTRFVCAFR